VADAASAGDLRRVGDGCRGGGGEKDRVNMWDRPLDGLSVSVGVC